ncbi:hypothetical protein OS493_031510 [Desmophyllum pertusum]|uniref:Uncharacterized protein n=1 Tax=Desmophyllum pertusum TaxID=174260 RepID=A0A9X0CUW3_9CNID|nr:hypothetical protein OS493_031510 [Desmophyllum pertusum]
MPEPGQQSHALHNELKHHKVISARPEYIILWTNIARDIPEDVVPVDNITSDPRVVYNDKPLLVEAMGANIMLKCPGQYLESREGSTIIATVGSFRDNITAPGGMVTGLPFSVCVVTGLYNLQIS